MKKIIILFLIWRLSLFLIAAISESILPTFGARFPYYQERLIDTQLPHFIWSFGNFDGVHYLGIAASGYSAQFTQAFFPLYPILIKIISFPLGIFLIEKTSFLISALLISNLAFLFSVIVFYKLVKKIKDEKTALWSCCFVFAFPTSFFFASAYTESLFLLLALCAFFLVEIKKIVLASVIGAFASATRLIGTFLAVTLSYTKNKTSVTPLLIVPIGLIAYMAYLKIEFNDPLYFLSAQSAFGQERSSSQFILLPQVLFRYLKILLTNKGLPFYNALFELSSTILAISILLFTIGKKHIRGEWIAFSSLSILTPTLTGTLASMPRYVLIAFPIYIYLGSIKNLKIKLIILSIFIALLIISTALFTQGYWVA